MTTPDVVASVARQSEQAAALAGIAGQGRLADPSTNPAVREHADRLRNERQRKELDARQSRALRRDRVADKRAGHAEKTLEVLQSAKQMSSPARSVMALHAGRKRFLGLSLACSLTLSAGSATGLGDLANRFHAHQAVGWVAEVGLTGLSTMAVLYRSHLGEHGGRQAKTKDGKLSWQEKVLWLLMVVPVAASIVANAVSHGTVGVFCSIGAAAFSLFSYVISDQSGTALADRAGKVTGAAEAELYAVAMGEESFTAVQAGESAEAERDAEALFTTEALAAWLSEPPEDGVTSVMCTPDADGPQGAVRDVPAPTEAATMRPAQIDGDQRQADDGSDAAQGLTLATRARRAAGQQTRQRIAEYMAQHPAATVERIAEAVGVSPATVKRHRRDINRTTRMEAE